MNHYADFSKGDVIKVHSKQFEEFKRIAENNNEKKRYRLCMHDTPENKLQEMMICKTIDDYGPPHKHQKIVESHIVLRGKELVVLFSDNGEITDAFVMQPDSEFISYRINTDVYHMSIVLSEASVDYEVKVGPFDPKDNVIPDWAPNPNNKNEIKKFIEYIKEKSKKFLEK